MAGTCVTDAGPLHSFDGAGQLEAVRALRGDTRSAVTMAVVHELDIEHLLEARETLLDRTLEVARPTRQSLRLDRPAGYHGRGGPRAALTVDSR